MTADDVRGTVRRPACCGRHSTRSRSGSSTRSRISRSRAAHVRALRRDRSVDPRRLPRARRLSRSRERARRSTPRADRRSRSRNRVCAAAAARRSRPGIKWKTVLEHAGRPEVRRLQCGRGRFRHVLGPHDHGGRSVRADRGHDDRGIRRRRDARLRLPALRVPRRASRDRGRHRSRDGRTASSAATSSAAARRSISRCGSARAPTSAAKRPRCSRVSRASAAWCGSSRRCPRSRDSSASRPLINNVISLASRADHSRQGRRVLPRFRRRPLARHAADPARRQRQARRPDRARRSACTLRELLYDYGGGIAIGPADPRRAGRRTARRLSASVAVRHAARLRGVRGRGRDARPRRYRRVRRHGRHGASRRASRWSSARSSRAASARRAGSAPYAASRSSTGFAAA